MAIGGEFCHCIESALKGIVERKLPGANTCRLCHGYGCNSPKHPGILATPVAKRLSRAPYCLSGRRSRFLARKRAHKVAVDFLKAAWAREEAANAAGEKHEGA